MSVTIEHQQEHHHLSLINWLAHITHKHHTHHNHHTSKSTAEIRIPAIEQEKEKVSSTTPISDDEHLLTCSITVKHTQPLHPKKHHYLHRHHEDENSADVSDSATIDSNSDKHHICKCREGHRRLSSLNDADDEMSSDLSIKNDKGNIDNGRGSSDSGNGRASSSTTSAFTNNNNNNKEHRKSVLSIESRNSSSSITSIDTERHREKSIHTLPEDVDDPSGGYKSLKEDGGLIDYDSSGFEADDEGSSEVTKDIYSSTKVIIKHNLVKLALNGLFRSPIHDEPKKQVLHVGCGDGSWCVDVAQLHPDWLVIGMDDKTGGPIQDHRKVPRNFKYVRCYYDVLKTLQDMPEHSFDLVYGRFLIYSYGEEDYARLVSECKRICKKGGYVELIELDMSIYGNPVPGPITRAINENVFHAMEERKLTPVLAPKLADILLKAFSAKYEDKTLDKGYTSLPLGLWGGRMGVLFRDDINELFHVLELYAELQREEKFGNKKDTDNNLDDSDNDDNDTEDTLDSSSVISHSMEVMDEELESRKAFMNLHHACIQKAAE